MTVQTKLSSVYCMDASVLINMKNYPRKFFPTIWEKIEELIPSGRLISPIEVYRELKQVEDNAYNWSKKINQRLLTRTETRSAFYRK